MSPELALLLVAAGLVSGTLIGTIGVGGVLLVPAMVLLGGIAVEEATPIASMSFFFTGVAGTWAYARAGRIDWGPVWWLMAGVVPGALIGASINVALAPRLLSAVVAAVLAAAAMRALAPGSGRGVIGRDIPTWALLGIGMVVGVGSALSGTGGPVLLIPIMLLAGGGVVAAIASSQPIQIPIAVVATLAFLAYGVLDWELGLLVGVAQVGGVLVGAKVGRRLPVSTLRGFAGAALAVSAAAFTIKAVTG